MTGGQRLALAQLQLIASADPHAVEISEVTAPAQADGPLLVLLSLHIGDLPRAHGGLPLRDRESFRLGIDADFPFVRPETFMTHARFAGWPHVQWKRYLCLYQSATEWNPSDGMFGYLDRLWSWLKRGAVNQLDPDGLPLHPPAVYTGATGKLVVPVANTPAVAGDYWLGVASWTDHAHRIELVAWHEVENLPTEGRLAVAVLMGNPLPWEYPKTGAGLFAELDGRGLPADRLYRILQAATILTPEGEPLYFVLGSPMRGIAGGLRKQHLSVWSIDAKTVEYIRLSRGRAGDTDDIAEIRGRLAKLMMEDLGKAALTWCPVMEARPEVTVRRDHDSPVAIFRGKAVTLWGCGALGSYLAQFLCRAGVNRLVLWDRGTVNPGILVRQSFFANDVGRPKVEALRDQLIAIRPDVQVEIHNEDITDCLADAAADWTGGSDFVVDATAAAPVRQRLEMAWSQAARHRVPVAAVMIDQSARRAIVGVVNPDHSGATWDVFRKTKIELLRRRASLFADAFFPEKTEPVFQPEPGCSEPTFVGSAPDSAGLAALGLNLVATDLREGTSGATAHVFAQPSAAEKTPPAAVHFAFLPDMVSTSGDYQVRVSAPTLKEIKAFVAQNRRLRTRRVETGGLLWGEWDEAMRIVWVTDASGPPPDSQHSEERFICGVVGTKEEYEFRRVDSRAAVSYIGMWHTHPVSRPLPSEVDKEGMAEILTVGPAAPRSNLLLIIGRERGNDVMGNFLFERHGAIAGYALVSFGQSWRKLDERIL